MDDEPQRPAQRQPGGATRRAFESAYGRADRVLDVGQRQVFRLLWFFLPEPAVAGDPRFVQVLVSRFLSDAGQQGVAFTALVAVVLGGGSAFDAAIVGAAALVPAAFLGLFGGAVADALPKRVAMAGVYNLQALLCFVIPITFGTELWAVVALVFLVNTLGQVSGPTESSVVPLVASREQLATATSLIHFGSSLGTGFGTLILAPVLVKVYGVDTSFYVAGVMLLLAATRVFDLSVGEPARAARAPGARLRDWRPPKVHVRDAVEWLVRQPAIATILAVSVVSGTATIVVQTLGPRYVQSVLDISATDAVYVFAPSAVGLLLALAVGPRLMRAWGERITALLGFGLTAVALVLLGAVNELAGTFDLANPAVLADLVGADLSEEVRTAGLIAAVLGFGASLTTTSVQTYLNRRVPISYQGRAFALQSTLKNAIAIVPLLTLGWAATVFSVEAVLIVSPVVLLALAYGLVLLSFRFSGRAPVPRLEVVSSFWEEPQGEEAESEALAREDRGSRLDAR